MTQSQKLTEFYRAYLAWVLQGADVEHPTFSRSLGLCHNFWLFAGGMDNRVEARDLENELSAQFKAAGLDKAYPFNNGNASLYEQEGSYKHYNSQRLQWVIDHTNIDMWKG